MKTAHELLDDLRLVGPAKPLGNLPISTIVEDCHVDVTALRRELEQKGLKTLQLSQNESSISSGALYAYDEKALSTLLQNHADVLKKAGWPIEPVAFIRNLHVVAPLESDLFNVIADAYGDKTNPGRKK